MVDAEIPDLSDDVAATQQTTTRPPNEILAALRSRDDPIPRRCTQICASTATTLIKSITWNDVRIATASDSNMSALVDAVHNGFPDVQSAMFSAIRMYHQYRDKLTEYDGVILYKDRIFIPLLSDQASCRHYTRLTKRRVSMMVSRAEGSFFWPPSMTPAIEETRARCTACNRMAPSQPNAPHTPPIIPVYPVQAICADYFSCSGHHYLVAVDRYPNWSMVEENAEDSKGRIAALRRVFVTFGIVEELSSGHGDLNSWQEPLRHLSATGVYTTALAALHTRTVTAARNSG